MRLPFSSPTKNSTSRNYFCSLEIGQYFIKTAVWTIINDRIQVLTVGPTQRWDNITQSSLLFAVDAGLSQASNSLDPNGKVYPDKVILGLPADWLKENKIDTSKTPLLKFVLNQLSLKPIGFVVTVEAIVRYLRVTEGAPPSAIILGLWSDNILVTLTQLGKIIGSEFVTRGEGLTTDVKEGLSRFLPSDMFPSRILLYNTHSDLESDRQKLLNFPWQAPQHRLPFLHFPKIEILPSDYSIRAISTSGGGEVAEFSGWIPPAPVTSPDTPSNDSPNLGFVENIDVATVPDEISPPHHSTPKSLVNSKKITVPKLRFPSFHLPPIRLPGISSRIGLLLLPFLVIGFALFAYFYLSSATIVLFVNPRTLSHSFTVTGSQEPQLGRENTLQLTQLEAVVTAEKSAPTTSQLLVGDKATGQVNLINGTPVLKTFPAGTLILAPNGTRFTTDTAVTVASASGTADPNSYQPGKSSVSVTANEIGSDSNLSAGTQFTISSYSPLDYIAKNDSAFSGGSSRQAAAVGKEDLTALRQKLQQELAQQALDQIRAQADSTKIVIPESQKTTVVSESTNHKVGDLADSVTMTLSLKATISLYDQEGLKSLLDNSLKNLYPEGFKSEGEPEYSVEISKTDNQLPTLQINATTRLIPDIDMPAIARSLSGKKVQPSRLYLESLPQVASVRIKFDIPHFAPLDYLPLSVDRIHLSTQTSSP